MSRHELRKRFMRHIDSLMVKEDEQEACYRLNQIVYILASQTTMLIRCKKIKDVTIFKKALQGLSLILFKFMYEDDLEMMVLDAMDMNCKGCFLEDYCDNGKCLAAICKCLKENKNEEIKAKRSHERLFA